LLETSYPLTNADYRRLNHVDTIRAGQELRELVQTGLVDQHSTGRWTHYSLKVPGELPVSEIPKTDKEKISNSSWSMDQLAMPNVANCL
jgi:hypothetical protein